MFEPTMGVIIDDLNPPSYGVNSDAKRAPVHDPVHWVTKLVGFPWFNLGIRTQAQRAATRTASTINPPAVPYVRRQSV